VGGCFVRQSLVCRVSQCFGEVGGEYFGMEVLAGGFRRCAGGLFDQETVLKELNGFLDAPVGMVQLGKVGCGVGFGIDQGVMRFTTFSTSYGHAS